MTSNSLWSLSDTQRDRLRHLLESVLERNPFWQKKFQPHGITADRVSDWDSFRQLPFTTKAELVADQETAPPYGSNLTDPLAAYSRLHQTSGTTGKPLRWLDTPGNWEWFLSCWADIYRFAGITAADRIAFPFSFGPFIGFWAAFDGAARMGALCLPGGGISSGARLKQIIDNEATVVCCTPTYALRLAEVAAETSLDLRATSVRKIVVAGEPGGNIPATRQRIATAWDARVIDHWGMTEIGSLGVEPDDAPGMLDLLTEHCIAEVIDPETSEPVATGELGELVITNLGRVGSPLIRYRTGDLVRVHTTGHEPGRLRLDGGILGRADDMVIVRGNNVFPSSIEAILRRFDDIAEFRIVVETVREMQSLRIEIEPIEDLQTASTTEELVATVANTLKNELNFQVRVDAVERGSLPRFELKGRRFIRE